MGWSLCSTHRWLSQVKSVPGSVHFLASIPGYPQYSGNVMVPFSNDFSLFVVQPTKLTPGDNAMEMKSQDSNVKYSAARTGWGQKSSQNSNPLTPCYAETKA